MPNEFYIINHATGRIVDGFPSFAEAEQECAWWCEQHQQVYVVRELPALSFHQMLAYNRRQTPAREALRQAAEALAARLSEMMAA